MLACAEHVDLSVNPMGVVGVVVGDALSVAAVLGDGRLIYQDLDLDSSNRSDTHPLHQQLVYFDSGQDTFNGPTPEVGRLR